MNVPEEDKSEEPLILYSQLSPIRTRVASAVCLGNFGFFSWFLESTNTPGHFIEEIPNCGVIGMIGLAGSAGMLTTNIRSREHNVAMIKLHKHAEGEFLEVCFYDFLGRLKSKFCPTGAISVSPPNKTNRESDKLYFKVPEYDRRYFEMSRTGGILEEEELKRLFGELGTRLED